MLGPRKGQWASETYPGTRSIVFLPAEIGATSSNRPLEVPSRIANWSSRTIVSEAAVEVTSNVPEAGRLISEANLRHEWQKL